MPMRRTALATHARPVARIWWLATRRQWRENTILIPIWVAFMAVYVYHVARVPARGPIIYVCLLIASALITALLIPIPIGATSVFESRRFDLLPIPPFGIFLLRPALGNSFRLLLTAPVWVGSAIGVLHLALGPLRGTLALLQLTGWVLAGIVGAELLEQVLRHRASVVLHTALSVVLVTAALLLVQVGQAARDLTTRSVPMLGQPIATLFARGSVPLAWHVTAAAIPFAVLALALVASKLLAERHASFPPRTRQPLTLAGPLTTLARVLAPRAPSALAKELGHAVRIHVFWLNHGWLFVMSAVAFLAKNPPLLAATFLSWIGTGYNILGADVPMGGLTRYALLPRPLAQLLTARHGAILASGTLTALAALVVVSAFGGMRHAGAEHAAPIAYVLWYAYGASLFLLCSIPGDWFSARQPRPITLRVTAQRAMGAGRVENVALWLVTYAGTIGASVVLLLACSAVLGGILSVRAPFRLLTALLLTSLIQSGLYAYRHRARARH